mgnify:FL=1
MQITGFTKTFLIYSIRCNTTNKVYVGSTANLQSRLNVHLSSFKKGTSKCSSVKVLENNNFSVSVLRDKILNHDDAKIAELNFINAFGPDAVNANKPISCSKEEYTKKYQNGYYKKRKLLLDTAEDEYIYELIQIPNDEPMI